MNKKLIALAVSSAFAGAVAAPVAMADNSGVTIYGSASVSVDYVKGLSNTTDPLTTNGTSDRESRARVSSNNSYMGFKGTEDLGNGLAAIWQLEYAIDFTRQNTNNVAASDTVYSGGSTGVLSARNSFVGLSSKSWGAVTLGVQESPLKTSTGKLDYFKDTLADYRGIFTTNAGSQRPENSILYSSPKFSGVDVKAMTATPNRAGNGNATNPRLYSMSVTYDNGPLFLVGAYENTKQLTAYAAPTSSVVTQKTSRLGAGYKFGDFTVGLGYEHQKASGNSGASTFSEKRNAWNLGASYAVTKADVIKLQYTKVGDCSGTFGKTISGVAAGGAFCSGTVVGGSTTVGAARNSSSGAKQWSLGLDHNMSKRTKLYALYTRVSNDTNAAYSLGGGATGITPVNSEADGNANGFALGMVHSF